MQLVDPALYKQLKASGQLPSPKGVGLAIAKLLQCDDYKIDDLVRLVQSDPAIAGDLLKFSNAASYGHNRPIVSLSKAVTTLGTLRVRVLVLALSVLHNHRSGNCPQFDYKRFWSRALAAAISAQALAHYAQITPEENFTAGLLCSVGELALASIFPERYGEIISTSDNEIHKQLALEREAFDTDHRELASTLLMEWGLPEVLATAVYHCELPDEAGLLDGSRVSSLTSEQRAQVHQALRVSRHVAHWQQRFRLLPELRLSFFLASVTFDGAVARQYAFDVAIENRAPLMEHQGADGGGGGTAYAGQCEDIVEVIWKFSVMPLHDELRRTVQIARTRVVAQPAPVRQHVVLARRCERGNIRETCYEALVIRDDGGDLGLLQHDLGQPHTVGIRTLPRQAVAAILALPANEARCKITHR